MLRRLAAQIPAIPSLQTAASAPPATITSAAPLFIISLESPIECAPVAQAVTTEWFGPLKPYFIEIWPDKRFTNEEGIKNGDNFFVFLLLIVNYPS